eukprot:TRINITY_DN16187_c0_g1_i1.p1 TRINITY_DN16187_c0_g1~~TRINITY_DN16187_c0_g1_i1.p1  ORF type:complete len:1054 (-),score=97.01 TRINITY_DN16187_c0_g1_i1:147-3308(-)
MQRVVLLVVLVTAIWCLEPLPCAHAYNDFPTTATVTTTTTTKIKGLQLYDALDAVNFLNEGQDSANYSYAIQPHGNLFYTEPLNVTSGWGVSWDTTTLLYPYRVNTSSGPVAPCSSMAAVPGDRPGGDLTAVPMATLNATQCGIMCCNNIACVAWVMAKAPGNFFSCVVGQPCCYLKQAITAQVNTPGIVNALIKRPELSVETPVTGIRSAVPLGGVACGSIELRADGTFQEWTIINQSPGGSPKFGVVDDAILAVRTRGHASNSVRAAAVRTRPPRGLPGVASLRYRGSYPVTRLDIGDPQSPVEMAVFGYSVFKPGDLNRSVTPAIAFTLNAYNPSNEVQDVSLMLSLPFSNEPDTIRAPSPGNKNVLRKVTITGGAAECMHLCRSTKSCASWSLTSGTCTLQSDVPPNNYKPGSVSGVMGMWDLHDNSKTVHSESYRAPSPINLNRPGRGPMAGNISMWASGQSQDPAVSLNFTSSYGTGDDLTSLFRQFEAGVWPTSYNATAIHGAAVTTVTLPPGMRATLTIVFAWYFPYRDHVGPSGNQPTQALVLGNWYNNLFRNSSQVASTLLPKLTSVVEDILAMQAVYYQATMPESLRDYLVNGMSHIRSAIYTADGTWRQWEAYDCVDIDSVHNDYQRHMPYMIYFPETEKQKLLAHGAKQLSNGMIQEELSGGCIGPTPAWESAGGRRMGDVTTIFIAQVWQFYAWANDLTFLRYIYPRVRAAVQWQVSVSPNGLPEHLINTYDILALDQYPLCTFNSVLHLMAMRAAVHLASVMNDTATVKLARESFDKGSILIDQQLWYNNSDGKPGYYQSYNGVSTQHAVMVDALYGQVVAYTLGLGSVLPLDKMRAHLMAELKYNDGPYGLIVQTGREPPTNKQDNAIWMGGSQDWSALALRVFDTQSDFDYADLLRPSEKGLNHWRMWLRDPWNTHGLVASNGYTDLQGGLPLCTAHYGFHMVLWHIPFSLSRQTAYLFNSSLSFAPVTPVPYNLPLLLPNTLGYLTAAYTQPGEVRYTVALVFGSLRVASLSVSSSVIHNVALAAGQQVSWTTTE